MNERANSDPRRPTRAPAPAATPSGSAPSSVPSSVPATEILRQSFLRAARYTFFVFLALWGIGRTWGDELGFVGSTTVGGTVVSYLIVTLLLTLGITLARTRKERPTP